MEAVESDPEYIEARLAEGEPADEQEWHPRRREWTLQHEIMAGMLETLINTNLPEGKKPYRFPRPFDEYAIRLKEKREASRHAFIDDLLGGHISA